MNALLVPFRQLVERKLWPVAVLLVAAMAAVPMLLASGDEPAAPGPRAQTGGATTTAAATEPIVSLAAPEAREKGRRVLGSRKNPFKPAVLPKKAKADDGRVRTTRSTGSSSGADKPAAPSLGGGSPATTPGGGAPFAPVAPVAPKKVYELYSLTVRFGLTSGTEMKARNLKRLKALPSVAQPVVIYLGLLTNRKTAVFLVDGNVKVQGDGSCHPDPRNCQTVHLTPGETAFLDVVDADGETKEQYQLDYVRVRKTRTTDAEAARRARRSVAGGGREILRSRISRVSGHKYDPDAGVIRAPK